MLRANLLRFGSFGLGIAVASSVVASNGPVTVWFTERPPEISDKLALLCSNRDATVIEQDDRHVLCTKTLDSIGARYLLGARGSTTPQLNVRFSILRDEKLFRVQASQWVEVQSALGQTRRTELTGKNYDAEMMKLLMAVGAHNYPIDPEEGTPKAAP